MSTPPIAIPRPIPLQRFRLPQKNIPQTYPERSRLMLWARQYVQEHNPVPPLSERDLKAHAERLAGLAQCDPTYGDYLGVLLSNEIWREALAAVPFERRLLLLPKCLR